MLGVPISISIQHGRHRDARTIVFLTIIYSVGDARPSATAQTHRMIFTVLPIVNHDLVFMGCTMTTYLEGRGITMRPPTTWARWRHQMETFSVSLALCGGNPPVTGGFPSQRPVKRSFDTCFDLSLNKRLSKQSRSRWFETPLHSLWRHCNDSSQLNTKCRFNIQQILWSMLSGFVSLFGESLHWHFCID